MARSISIGTLQAGAEAAVVVAHPDDEVLWSGGTILSQPDWRWWIVTLCRGSDPDRAPKFRRVLESLGAEGDMADLDDGPSQKPLDSDTLCQTVLRLLCDRRYDLVLTHGPCGEYTRHRRHEECCRAVVGLWRDGRIRTDELWLFAYDDDGGTRLPHVSGGADLRMHLDGDMWREKRRLVTGPYGFADDSWEARCTPREEGFRIFHSPGTAAGFLESNRAPP